MKKIFIVSFTILIIKINCYATIAVLPFENLSKDLNGLDLNVSTLVADKLIDLGYDVVYPMEIMFYLEKNNIPFTGWIDSLTAKEISKIFRCDLIMLGTIIEKDKKNINFVLSLRIFSVSENTLIWGNTFTILKSQQISILDIKHRTFNQILNETITKILKRLPESVITKSIQRPDFDIENVFISPKYSRTGRLITCKVKLKFSGRRPDSIFLIIGKQKIRIKLKKDEIIYKFVAPQKEKRYPISIEVKWDKPFYFSKKIFLTSFFVDNTPPEFKIKYKFASILGKKVYFNKFLKIIPILKKEEKISKWKFEIISTSDNNSIISLKNRRNLPKFFIWKGTASKGTILPNGKYILRITIFDMANNEFSQSLEVYLVKTIIPPKVTAILSKDKKIIINLDFKPHPVKINLVRIEIYDKNGNLIATKENNGIINRIEIIGKQKLEKIIYSLEIKDSLGNRIFLKKRKINLVKRKVKKKKNKKIWLNEF